MFPIRVTLLAGISLAPFALCRLDRCLLGRADRAITPGHRLGKADDLVADHFISQEEDSVELGYRRRIGTHLQQDVIALLAMAHLIGEPAPPPPLGATGVAPLAPNGLGGALEDGPDDLILQAGVQDDDDLIRPHSAYLPVDPSLATGAPQPGQGSIVKSECYPSPLHRRKGDLRL
jgi:hypothetical protein